jgi:hypothetical protein
LVADLMTMGVVDELEAIDVDEEHADHRSLVAVCPPDSQVEAIDEQGSVRKARQGVVQGLVGKAPFVLSPRRDHLVEALG